MSQQSIPTFHSPDVRVARVQGNFQVKGWERAEVNAKGSPGQFTLQEQEDVYHLESEGSCVLRIPFDSSLSIDQVEGSAQIKRIEDTLQIQRVHDSLSLKSVADTQVEQVDGELQARDVNGRIHVEKVGGNANVRQVQGDCFLETVEGNLNLRDLEGNLQATCSGNAYLRLSNLVGEQYDLEAEGNLSVRLPEGAGVTLTLISSGGITVKTAQGTRSFNDSPASLVLGGGQAQMRLSAGGSLAISADEPGWEDMEETDPDPEDAIPSHFSEQISRQVEAQIDAQLKSISQQMSEQLAGLSNLFGRSGLSPDTSEAILQRARENSERAAARAQERLRREQEKLERKLESARRRSELKAQNQARRTQSRSRQGWSQEAQPGAGEAAQPHSATEEERLMILKMLEQKKITLEEAERLLSVLEGESE